jgi:small subunit ribosomal protein S3
MGQKVNPIGFRLHRTKDWRSVWFANKKEFGSLLVEDMMIRKYLKAKKSLVGSSRISIYRMSDKVEITIHTARPGLVIGKKGSEIDTLKAELRQLLNKDVWIEVDEIKRPDLDAYLVAEGIARQIERRIPFRRAMKKGLQSTMDAGAQGIKVQVSGRLSGADIARREWYKEGRIPLHTIRANIDYAVAEAHTTYGVIGVAVWVNQGESATVKAS